MDVVRVDDLICISDDEGMYVHRVASDIVSKFFNDVVFDTLIGSTIQIYAIVNATVP